MITLLDKLTTLPPYKLRLLARHKWKRRPMTNLQISERSGLALETVRRLSRCRSWNKITVETMLRFSAACGVEMLHQRRAIQFIKESDGFKNAAHLKKSSNESRMHTEKYFESVLNGGTHWRGQV